VKFVVLAVCLAACAWPQVACPEGSRATAKTHLKAIDILTRKNVQDVALKQRILDATFHCRKNCHRDPFAIDVEHCRFLIAALKWAIKNQYEQTAKNLEHDSEPRKAMEPELPKLGDWPDVDCGAGMTGRDYLDAIAGLAGASGLDPALLTTILTLVEQCATMHKDPVQYPLPYHCGKVEAAYVAAVEGNWDQCIDELDHMPEP
jgi:hypothetical protein